MHPQRARLLHHFDKAPQTAKEGGRLAGFDEEFTDIVDYILRITHRIWEGKQVGLCYDYYSEDCPVYTLADVFVGSEEVVQNTLNTLAAFPDRTLHAENVIWGGDDAEGFHTSHRILSHMTNLGDSGFGGATNRHAAIYTIAHCIVKANKVVEEWLVRDNLSLVKQLGLDPHAVARKQAQSAPTERLVNWQNSELERLSKIDRRRIEFSAGAQEEPESFIRSVLQNIWNARMLGDVYQNYAENARLCAPAGRILKGQREIAEFYLQLLGTLSTLRFSVDHVCCQPSHGVSKPGQKIDLAVRWTLSGKHQGAALYGPPTGAEIFILGASHYLVEHGKIQEEWTLFDELSVFTQVYRARLRAAQSEAVSTGA